MATRMLTGAYPNGYTLKPVYGALIIETGASVGGSGVSASAVASVVNHGVVDAVSDGVFLHAGGTVINGSASDTSALIATSDGKAVSVYGAVNTVINYGTVRGGGFSGDAVRIYDAVGAVVTNLGALVGEVGLANGITAGHCSAVTVTNSGVISGPEGSGIWFSYDDADNNTVSNTGTIEGGGYGILFQSGGGVVTNGSATDTSARISADNGGYPSSHWALSAAGYSLFTNFGTIVNTGSNGGRGVRLQNGGTLTNGSAADAAALIEAASGIGFAAYGGSAVTLTNFGTIEGKGVAVSFSSSADVLRVEAGCAFEGAVEGAGGLLDLSSGTGHMRVAGADGVTVWGSMARTTFAQFGNLEIDVGADFALAGKAQIGAGGIETLTVEGRLVVADQLTGAGTLAVGSGTLVVREGASVDVSNATFAAGAVIKGGGKLTLGDATVAGLFVGQNATVIDAGTVDQTGDIRLHRDAGSPRLIIASGAIWRLDGNIGIAKRASGEPVLTVDGVLIKSQGGGVSEIGVATEVDGVAEAARGALDFGAAVSGAGTLKVDGGARLACDGAAAATLSVRFAGAGGVLALKDPAAFAATIAGLAPGETIDLVDVTATSAVLGPGDMLVIANGDQAVASLQLAGDYVGDSFALATDGEGGTSITVSTGPGEAARAPIHGFVAAAASLGARGADLTEGATRLHLDPMSSALASPRVNAA